ncbi:MAG: hypothetical protein MMC33_009205 [Icmadophila ericetorum]|nr:hypothetical protein [Icmadophila ericetorum]
MASKLPKAALTGVHTAGIYADMTVDGPDIGTLVVVVDRARNLPNRKTMGKQDPYCACRLGKEAKKTETDRRGGQTPKWDQELRFTVHDSPDYHQLKVSCFNDDKKTDLIGEAWVPLDKVVVPGGGKNDLWHPLNCKGRYAGDIRIELTYYDTRPKEERMEALKASSSLKSQEQATNGVGGPRTAKSVTRRPLPADPVSADSSPSRPLPSEPQQASLLPHTPHRPTPLPYGTPPYPIYGPDDYKHIVDNQSPQLPQLPQQRGSSTHTPLNQEPFGDSRAQDSYPGSLPASRPEQYSYQEHSSYPFNENLRARDPSGNYPDTQSQHYADPRPSQSQYLATQQQPYNDLELPSLAPTDPRPSRYSTLPAPSYETYSSQPSPAASLPQYQPGPKPYQAHYPQVEDPISPTQYENARNGYDSSPVLYQSQNDYSPLPQLPPVRPSVEEDIAPPPPPAHRSSGFSTPVHRDSYEPRQDYSQVIAPLNVRNRGSTTGSPLSRSIPESMPDGYPATPTSNLRNLTYPPSTFPVQTPLSQSAFRHSQGPTYNINDTYGNQTPPSLVPSYNPRIAQIDSERYNERRMSAPPNPGYGAPPYDRYAIQDTPARNSPLAQYQGNAQPGSSGDYANPNRTPSAPTVPMIKPRALSPLPFTPDPRVPPRKSLSPRPESQEPSLPSTPYSPDSYEVLNPNLKSAAPTINATGATYNTPEQAKDAARQRQLEEELEKGPIIGADGREIDPSDHLPTETWAPEPERKTPRRGPEITLRFRNSPQGAQPMPNSAPRLPRETVIRPHSISSTPAGTHAYSADSISPTMVVSRNRLQKKNARASVAITHANSSPAAPLSGSASASADTSPYPLRERVNYGADNSPVLYTGGSLGGGGQPPPVPAKIPLGAGREDWSVGMETDFLSEEIRRIDIGGTGSGKRARRGYEAESRVV